ncbi:unnamed protein product [Adineta steineri]|uniref:Uncharacterized protein n=1 Tax=Adineta steineri TaxID=433720 RepID=A0A814C5G3_9BILA|nr:unnamed protein product [Adineta steineri]CAF4057179.1 unnamed protein product [Adineta steineri]
MGYDTGIFVFNRITDEKKWKLFLEAVYNYFLLHQDDKMHMVVNRDESTGEFQALTNECHPVVTDLKLLHLTDQFNFIKGDTDDSFYNEWLRNLANKLYGKDERCLTEEEKSIVYEKSIKKVRGLAKRMDYSLTEDELQRLIGMNNDTNGEFFVVTPPVAISIENITLPPYAHHFKKVWGQVWHPMCSEWVIKILRRLLSKFFPEEEHYCYFNELHYLNDPNETPVLYYSSDRKYRQHVTQETREENNAFYQQIQGGTAHSPELPVPTALEEAILEHQNCTQSDEAPAWQTYLEIVEIANKGRGYRARCNIPSVTCIMHDTPLASPSFPSTALTNNRQQYPPHIMEGLILQVLENKEYFALLSPQVASGRFSQEASPYPSRYSNKMWQLAYEKVLNNVFSGDSPDSNMSNRRLRYDQLTSDLQSMFGRSTPRSCSAWLVRAERWLTDAGKPPYQLHQFHWLAVHIYKLLRDRYKTMYLSHAGNREAMRKKVLYYGKLIIRAEFAVLQPLDPCKQGVDAFLDDWNDMDMPKNGARKLLKELEPNAELIIKQLNE